MARKGNSARAASSSANHTRCVAVSNSASSAW
ncbi:Uncharacterised protein [Bordetella pertussis]|nr:Uncharacterised protein [Bordetella pertussis]